MRVKMILPALTEAHSSLWRPLKYSLFPPLGLATLAAYLPPDADIEIQDEHVETLDLCDHPDLVVIQVYITSAYRAYEIADHYRRQGSYVCLGGLHVTARPREAMNHADSIFLGPGEDTWPQFLEDFRRGEPNPEYRSTCRTLDGLPPVRRDLIQRDLYLTPNTLVVSRGCPHACDFCTRITSTRAAARIITSGWIRSSPRSTACPVATSFSTTTSLPTPGSAGICSGP